MDTGFQLGTPFSPLLGLVKNKPPEQLAPGELVTAHNVVLRNGQLEKVSGWTKVGQVPDPVTLVLPITYQSGTVCTIIGTTRNIYRHVNGQAPVALNPQPFTATPGQRWEADYLNGKWYFTNQADGAWSWDGINQLVQVVTGAPAAAHLAQYANHLILANLFGQDVPSSETVLGSGLLVADWDTANVNSDADLFVLAENGSPVQRLLRLRNGQLAIYKRDVTYDLQYIGPGLAYTATVQVPNRGVLAPASVLDLGDRHFYVSNDNLRLYDGSTDSPPLGDRVWSWWNSQLAKPARERVWGALDRRSAYQQVTLGYREINSNTFNRALVWSYQYDAFSSRDWPFLAAGYVINPSIPQSAPTFDQLTKPMDDSDEPFQDETTLEDYALLAGDESGNLWLLDDTTQQANGAELVMTIETGLMDLGDASVMKTVNALMMDVPQLTGSALQVFVGVTNNVAKGVTYGAPRLYDGTSQFVRFMAGGRWVQFKFVKTDGALAFRGFAPMVQARGPF